jgi:hypothetical protein
VERTIDRVATEGGEMSGTERCDEVLRLIDEVLVDEERARREPARRPAVRRVRS